MPYMFRVFNNGKERLFRDYGIIIGTKAIVLKAVKPAIKSPKKLSNDRCLECSI